MSGEEVNRLAILWAPWRIKYIRESVGKKATHCIFCEALKLPDNESLILLRSTYAYVIMNAFPYNNGHLLITPYRHIATLEQLDDCEIQDIHRLMKISLKILRKAMNPHGFNIGINLGRVAGAGIDDHVHVHIVPRWNGDTNFMTTIGGTRVIPQSLRDLYSQLKPLFEEEDKKTRRVDCQK
ncbi:MAG: HIT domain-containing protein [Desulfurococcales archaeon]|nr:HIT domain-containing protein [Desulfurococcales archaeon]